MPSGNRVRIRKPTHEESSSSRSSAHVIASNDDLLSELLLCLPIKSLLKFKSVSKHWLSLITDPHLCHRKNLKPTPASALFLQCYNKSHDNGLHFHFVPLHPSQTTAPFTSLTFVDHPRGIDILQSCNGLLCCCSVEDSMSKSKYYIYNPTTKQFTTLPPLCGPGAMRLAGVHLAFDPSISHVYRVVCIHYCEHYDHCQILIYSSETKHWRVSGAPFKPPLSINFRTGVYWNGAIHWFSQWGTALYFDLNKELVQEISMPSVPDDFDETGIRHFGECGGHLHLVEICTTSMTKFNVYEMERDHSGWFVKFKVNLNEVAKTYLNIERYHNEDGFYIDPFTVLCVIRGEEEEDSYLVLHVPKKVIRYNLTSKTHEEICDADVPFSFGRPYAFQYIESLAPV